ncbi:hypothetical protein OHB49_13640 [Streptomyces sp. NBC_01717]|uniref:hypothetical protein n=1 Tax=Streptomyces sp. NBC_01717 TaxID=2975918 RepID=UPI002E320B31|nr:hypothetical protein [Streptomyces sp. NBC_01717]
MTRGRGRGSTGPGRAAALPHGEYTPASSVQTGPAGQTVVLFQGDDGRQARFGVASVPLEGWRIPLAEAFAQRIGPGGGLRTMTSATHSWGSLMRFMTFLASHLSPPTRPEDLTPGHVEAFIQHRTAATTEFSALGDWQAVKLVLGMDSIGPRLSATTQEMVNQRRRRPRGFGVPGYSDGEFARLLAAARADVAGIRDRIHAGEQRVLLHRHDPAGSRDNERWLAATLADMADTGRVPRLSGPDFMRRRIDLAENLYVVLRDLPPIMVLMVAMTERNSETIKELPAEHRILDGRAVELTVTKRRQGQRKWFKTVTWEIGPPERALHTPGGLYLLLHGLMARSRQACGSDRLICVWRNIHNGQVDATAEHLHPFASKLWGASMLPSQWAANRQRPVLADTTEGAEPEPLQVKLNRVKTSTEVRRTRRLGGHLPSAAKTNSLPVLFRNYLGRDPIVLDWADQVLGEALVDAEQAALRAHQQVLNAAGGGLQVVTGPTDADVLHRDAGLSPAAARQAAAGDLDTGWTACGDHDRHPATQSRCEASFLECFHCGNCLVTRDHLPRLLALTDALTERRQQMDEGQWWFRYGPAWVAIRYDILAKFSAAELAEAELRKPADAMLDLIEDPWEMP